MRGSVKNKSGERPTTIPGDEGKDTASSDCDAGMGNVQSAGVCNAWVFGRLRGDRVDSWDGLRSLPRATEGS